MSPMPRIHKGDTDNVYFLTPTVIEWINIFTKRMYFEILADSLKYCIKNKGLILYEYVFMTNHIHLIVGMDDNRTVLTPGATVEPAHNIKSKSTYTAGSMVKPGIGSGLDSVIRDFKRHTTKEVKKLLRKDNRKYILRLIKNSLKLKKWSEFQIWQRENYAEGIISDKFRNIKINYIWQNPVKKGYVLDPEDWLYSSARQKILNLPSNHPEVVLPCMDWH